MSKTSHTFHERINVVNKSTGKIEPLEIPHTITVDQAAPKRLGIMLVGWGGNNGTTLTAGILANKKKLTWRTKQGLLSANWYGSLTQSSVTKVGVEIDDLSEEITENYHIDNRGKNEQPKSPIGGGKVVRDVFKTVKDLVPLVSTDDLFVAGWDISGMNLYEACYRAKVLEPTLVEQLKDDLEGLVPMKAVFNPNYIASNQADRVDNIFTGTNQECVDKLRNDIQTFSKTVDKVIVLWTANTECFYEKDLKTADEVEELIANNTPIAGSMLYAVACAKEGVTFLNGSPQNTVSEGMIELFGKNKSFIGGADFKTGQTKFKSIMLDFFMGSGLRLASCMSYNHLGNNDGKNLNEPAQFRSKEFSKAGVLSDEIEAIKVLYPDDNKTVDHTIVIKYAPFTGDTKKAMDEYIAQIFLGGNMTLMTYATCEDSLLAAPIMLDLLLLGEFFTRIEIDGISTGPVLSYLSFFFKAPVTNHPEYVFNSFSKQKQLLINFLMACGGIPICDNTLLGIGL